MRAALGSLASLGLLALLALPAVPALSGCDSAEEEPVTCTTTDAYEVVDVTPSGTTLGATVVSGQCIAVRYEGRLKADSTVFDSGTFNFRAGTGDAIAGFSFAVVGSSLHGLPAQRVGETRHVTVPPALGYRNQPQRGRGGDVLIPACSTLEFEITVLDVLGASACQRF